VKRRAVPLTDLGNAERLVAQHGADIRFVPGLGWHHWDGRRWRRDDTRELQRRAKLTAREIGREAAACDEEKRRKQTYRWAIDSESERHLNAMVRLAESEQPVIAVPDALDADPYLLTCENGTIDLRTGRLRRHNPADLITKLAPVAYDRRARSTRWQAFLGRASGGDRELEGYLRRLAGYTLIGDTREEVLVSLHGPTNSGKTTFVGAIQAVLGEYAMTAAFETFLARRGEAGIRNDIARLTGTRMVVAVEADEGRQLAAGLIKAITGGDRVAARFLYREEFEFTPRFTLWMVANARPAVRFDDTGMWRRIRHVPFTNVIREPERDTGLKTALHTDPAERAAILAWAVNGALEWQAHGLDTPQRVRDYTNEYREENDPIGGWLAAKCELGPGYWETSKALRASYEEWSDAPISLNEWGKALRAHGCVPRSRRGGNGWLNVRLRVVVAGGGTIGKLALDARAPKSFPIVGAPAPTTDGRVTDEEERQRPGYGTEA
jgi:putative DNA primase/helicase